MRKNKDQFYQKLPFEHQKSVSSPKKNLIYFNIGQEKVHGIKHLYYL
jgi:hypothetical protein